MLSRLLGLATASTLSRLKMKKDNARQINSPVQYGFQLKLR